MTATHLVWFRNDLRTHDNAALSHACSLAQNGDRVLAVFLWTPEQWDQHDYGTPRRFAWVDALKTLEHRLAALGIEFSLLESSDWQHGVDDLMALAKAVNARSLSLHREFGWDEVQRDQYALACAQNAGIDRHVFEDRVTWDPSQILTGQGEMYRVVTPYKKAWLRQLADVSLSTPLPEPKAIGPAIQTRVHYPKVQSLAQVELPLNETAALIQLDRFIDLTVTDYQTQRDFPSVDGTSKLSAALANGAVSLRQCFSAVLQHPKRDHPGLQTWLSELIWREFYHYLLYWRPELAKHQPFYSRWDAFPWRNDKARLDAWQNGQTGVPIVDAGMRQLAHTGWMHNRVRMIVAMYLVKILQVDWRLGERWFARSLLDIDFASNNGGWQWCAATGVDAAPYFRIFNPVTQSQRFDPEGNYIRRWLPELSALDNRQIHSPDAVPGYSKPLIDYQQARAETLALFKAL
ncbi:cryptochrome/photolyase family protein [Saccharospirillum mangrovi]|uniref:cryptochrome/photolyase family protein n=1 Tax=Saccharospirillum mangrovi TaxID=2161747 RepID=UPI000D373046|nr:FAD-binding domain-containing protein [Saccharospirillum mangrovi]